MSKGSKMKNVFIAVLLAAFVSGCNSGLKLLDGIEKEPEIVDDISGVWVSDYCDVTSSTDMHRDFIYIDEYGNVEKGQYNYITDPTAEHYSYKCEGGFIVSIDSTDYVTSIDSTNMSYLDGSSTAYVKVIGFESGDSMVIDARHYYSQAGSLGDGIFTVNDVNDNYMTTTADNNSSYKRYLQHLVVE